MFQPSGDLCRVSYLLANSVRLAEGLNSAEPDQGMCPVCGKPMALGYALLLPAHLRPASEPSA
jgi:hypothetical protein